jgi:hypothetical protein
MIVIRFVGLSSTLSIPARLARFQPSGKSRVSLEISGRSLPASKVAIRESVSIGGLTFAQSHVSSMEICVDSRLSSLSCSECFLSLRPGLQAKGKCLLEEVVLGPCGRLLAGAKCPVILLTQFSEVDVSKTILSITSLVSMSGLGGVQMCSTADLEARARIAALELRNQLREGGTYPNRGGNRAAGERTCSVAARDRCWADFPR